MIKSRSLNLSYYTNKIVAVTMITFLFSAFCMVISDIHAPFTTHSYLKRHVVSISSQVAGTIDSVRVKNGDIVNKGTPLFSVDKTELIENRDIAYANLVISEQHIANLKIEVEIAKDKVAQQNEIVANSFKHYKRYEKLMLNNSIGQEQYDNAKLEYRDELKELEQNKLDLNSKEIKLGENGENGGLMLAISILNRSDNKVKKSITFSPISGRVTNLKLDIGQTIDKGTAQIAIASNSPEELIANFNEKSLGILSRARVLVVFDAMPGQVFHGVVDSVDSAVSSATQKTDDAGKEAYIEKDDRWIRKSQQIRSTIIFEQQFDNLVSGSKATVMVIPEGTLFWKYFSTSVMQLMAMFRYIY